MILTDEQRELWQKWIAALRSGKYEQGKGILRDSSDKFCCLGVACNIYDPDGWEKEPNASVIGYGTPLNISYMPVEVRQAFGLHGYRQEGLVRMNDRGMPFEEIADWLEKLMNNGGKQ